MLRSLRVACAVTLFTFAPTVKADPVSHWFDAAAHVAEARANRRHGSGNLPVVRAQVALAVFEAANAADRRYESYLGLRPAAVPVSQEAAIASAGHAVLLHHFPAAAEALSKALALNIGSIEEGPSKQAGLALGRDVAAQVLARPIAVSGARIPDYQPRTSPGVYVPTDLPVISMSYYGTKPWFLRSVTEVAAPPPPPLASDIYARDFDEVRRLGGQKSDIRTESDAAAAAFWVDAEVSSAIRSLMERSGRTTTERARFYAVWAMAASDAAAAVAVAKYDHGFWRPVTAIRNASDDGNASTQPDAAWVSYLPTPLHPEYPCGHCISAAVAGAIIEAEFGPQPKGGLTFNNPSSPGAAVTLSTTDEFVRAVSRSRIIAGAHFRFSTEAGEAMGRKIVRLALERAPRPLSIDRRKK